MFGLPSIEGATVKVEAWKGDWEYLAELQQVWLRLENLDPTWTDWGVLEQFASAFGTLLDVDW